MRTTVISILAAAVLIGGAVMFTGRGSGNDESGSVNNVSVVDGKQIIEIRAKGGYSPALTQAQAGMPTVIKVATEGTFDCSSALTIPSIGYNKYLPPSGETEIELPAQEAGATLRGLCAMGMYNLAINFN